MNIEEIKQINNKATTNKSQKEVIAILIAELEKIYKEIANQSVKVAQNEQKIKIVEVKPIIVDMPMPPQSWSAKSYPELEQKIIELNAAKEKSNDKYSVEQEIIKIANTINDLNNQSYQKYRLKNKQYQEAIAYAAKLAQNSL
jgi:tRNA G10  N-methylase Trm11